MTEKDNDFKALGLVAGLALFLWYPMETAVVALLLSIPLAAGKRFIDI